MMVSCGDSSAGNADNIFEETSLPVVEAGVSIFEVSDIKEADVSESNNMELGKVRVFSDGNYAHEWQDLYASYLDEIDVNDLYSIYIKDVNQDGIPDLILSGWHNKCEIAYFDSGELKLIELWNTIFTYYLNDTEQVLIYSEDGYTLGGYKSYTLYGRTDNGLEEIQSIKVIIQGNSFSDDVDYSYFLSGYEIDEGQFKILWETSEELKSNSEALAYTHYDITDFYDYVEKNLFH